MKLFLIIFIVYGACLCQTANAQQSSDQSSNESKAKPLPQKLPEPPGTDQFLRDLKESHGRSPYTPGSVNDPTTRRRFGRWFGRGAGKYGGGIGVFLIAVAAACFRHIATGLAWLWKLVFGRGQPKSDTTIKAPIAGAVVRVETSVGAEVVEGDMLLVLVAMEMETPLKAKGNGTVLSICVNQGDQVKAGQNLVEIG